MNSEDYLKTPEHFKMFIETKVKEQLTLSQKNNEPNTTVIPSIKKKSRFPFGRAIAASAAIAVIAATSVFAAKHFRLSDYFENSHTTYNESSFASIDSRDVSVKDGFPEQLKQFEVDSSNVFDQPLFTLTEAYYDGEYLYIYATATDDGQKYDAITSRVLINGTQYIGDFGRLTGQTKTDGFAQNEYVGTCHLDGLEGDNFTIEMPLSIYLAEDEVTVAETAAIADNSTTPELIRQGQQTVSFKITAADRVTSYNNQTVSVNSDVTADISDLKRTRQGIRLNLTWHLNASAAEKYLCDFEYTDQENANLKGYSKPDYQISDNTETNYSNHQVSINQVQSKLEDIDPVLVIRHEDGSADCFSKIVVSNVPEDAKELIIRLKHNGQVIDTMTVNISLE